jgi:hypothetical protein
MPVGWQLSIIMSIVHFYASKRVGKDGLQGSEFTCRPPYKFPRQALSEQQNKRSNLQTVI